MPQGLLGVDQAASCNEGCSGRVGRCTQEGSASELLSQVRTRDHDGCLCVNNIQDRGGRGRNSGVKKCRDGENGNEVKNVKKKRRKATFYMRSMKVLAADWSLTRTLFYTDIWLPNQNKILTIVACLCSIHASFTNVNMMLRMRYSD